MGDLGVLNLSKKSFSQNDLVGYFNSFAGDKSKLHTLILDDNFVRHLDLNSLPVLDLLQISVARNQVTRIQSVQKFLNLRVINLSSNLLIQLDGIDHLKALEWISVSGNQLSNVDLLNKCSKLVHVDASDNQLTQLTNLQNLSSLHTLLLHRNLITNLKPASERLPLSLTFLSLADNEIIDLNQVKYLASLPHLYQLSVLNNPCFTLDISVLETNLPPINYRPFIINWCNNLTILDGLHVTQRENMKAEWLLSQGRGRSFEVGQHIELIKYLSSVSPVISCQDANSEEMKLEKVLTQKKQHGTGASGYISPPKLSGGISKRTSYTNDEKSSDLLASQSRVPEHEKRKRIHAWLGEQSLDDQSSIHSAMLLPSGDSNTTNKQDVLPYNMSLLMSESEFVSGDDLPNDEKKQTTIPPRSNSPQHYNKPNHQYTPGQAPHAAYNSLGLIRQLYDSPSKTPKLNPQSGYTQRHPSTNSNNESENMSPSMVANPPSHSTKLTKDEEFQHSVLDEDVGVSMSVTKYEEYEMRPIKPLNSDLQKKIYGQATSSSNAHPKPRPQPLKKNTGSTSKHSVTRLRTSENTSIISTPMPSTKKQNNLTMKKQNSSPTKKETSSHKTSVLKPVTLSYHRKRQQQQHTSKEPSASRNSGTKRKKIKDVKSQQNKSQEHVDNGAESDVESNRSYTVYKHGDGGPLSPSKVLQTVSFPTDLRHVMAATKIQAAWRGFRARWRNLKVLEIRQELRARRSEQYISLLCNELQTMKEKQESEKRMRELQTEAIRFMWTQIRSLQEKVQNKSSTENGKKSTRQNSPEANRNKRTKTSPRRTPRNGSPQGSSRVQRNASPQKKLGRHAFECESIISTTCGEEESVSPNNKKKADASWKEDVEGSHSDTMATKKKTIVEVLAEDTDEGRGSLTTDMESGEAATKSKEAKENNALKQTVEQLQKQVLQLQDALLSFSDRLVASENEISNSKMSIHQEEILTDDLTEEKTLTVEENSAALTETVCVMNEPDSLKLELNGSTEIDNIEITSGRVNVPKMTVQEILTSLDSALTEKELWSLCGQSVAALQSRKNNPVSYLSLDTTYVHKDGLISFNDDQNVSIDNIYLAPELSEESNSPTIKSSIFGLSVTLWSSADYNMEENQAPCLSKQFEDLLVLMSNDDYLQRAELDDVMKLCEEYHSENQCNSLEVCASLFAEACDFKKSKKRSLNSTVLLEVLQEELDGRKNNFRSCVVPQINDCSIQLKPATARELAPKPKPQLSLHDQLMGEVKEGSDLKNCSKPKIFTVKDLFEKDPELLNKLNILPGQRRKNMKAMQIALRRQQPQDPGSPPRTGIPTPPRALRAEVRQVNSSGDNQESESCSVILRWHPAHVYDKQGNESKSDKIIGYRINVNGQPRGMVAGNKTRALLDGLRRSCEYRVNIRAISALGESDISNTVIVYIASLSQPQITSYPVNLSGSFDKFTASGEMESSQTTTKQPTTNSNPAKTTFKLGAVFPNTVSPQKNKPLQNKSGNSESESKNNEVIPEAMQTTSSNDSWTTAMSPENNNNKPTNSNKGVKKVTSSDDIVDRVLRRYGIQKSTSTLPPLTGKTIFPTPSRSSPVPPSTTADNIMDEDLASTVSEETHNTIASGASSVGENITPRSKALLDQLKDELLN